MVYLVLETVYIGRKWANTDAIVVEFPRRQLSILRMAFKQVKSARKVLVCNLCGAYKLSYCPGISCSAQCLISNEN
jgi:hypothetical protein